MDRMDVPDDVDNMDEADLHPGPSRMNSTLKTPPFVA